MLLQCHLHFDKWTIFESKWHNDDATSRYPRYVFGAEACPLGFLIISVILILWVEALQLFVSLEKC